MLGPDVVALRQSQSASHFPTSFNCFGSVSSELISSELRLSRGTKYVGGGGAAAAAKLL